MISKEEVIHIAKLARLQLTEKEIEKMQKDLSSILDYFNVLKKAPKVSVKKESISKITSVQRPDVVTPKSSSLPNALIELAPKKQDGYIKVKSIL